jgi:hypothetical protein
MAPNDAEAQALVTIDPPSMYNVQFIQNIVTYCMDPRKAV